MYYNLPATLWPGLNPMYMLNRFLNILNNQFDESTIFSERGGKHRLFYPFLVADSKAQTIDVPCEDISLEACSESTDRFSTIVPYHFVYAPGGSGPSYFTTRLLTLVFTLKVTSGDVIFNHQRITPSINITGAYNNSKYDYMPF